MTTVVNTPGTSDSGSGMGFLVGTILVILFLILLFVYGLPALRSLGGPGLNVPSQIDVNLNQPGQQGQ